MADEQRTQTQDAEHFKPGPEQLDTQPGKESEMRQAPRRRQYA